MDTVCHQGGCSRSFSSFAGLRLHQSKVHRAEYHQNVPVPQRKKRWEIQDLSLFARLKTEITYECGGVVPDDINIRLVGKIVDRSFDSIKSQRRNDSYKALVRDVLQALRSVPEPSAR